MQKLRVLMLALLLAFLVGGCGGGDEDESPPTERPVPPVEQNALDISVVGEGTVRVQGGQLDCSATAMCQGMFAPGAVVVLMAEPDSGWTHASWNGCALQNEPDRCTVFMDGDRSVSVTFLSDGPLDGDTFTSVSAAASGHHTCAIRATRAPWRAGGVMTTASPYRPMAPLPGSVEGASIPAVCVTRGPWNAGVTIAMAEPRRPRARSPRSASDGGMPARLAIRAP